MVPKITDFATEEYVSIPLSANVNEALKILRTEAPKGNVFYVYVVDESSRLQGVLSIRNLIVAEEGAAISELYSPNPVFLRDDTRMEDAYSLFSDSRFLSLPILNEEGKVMGVLNAHELLGEFAKTTDQLFEERSRGELYELLGIKAEDASLNAFATAKLRFPWLLINVVGGLLSAFLIEYFGKHLSFAVQALAFVPVLLILSESVGTQTASVVISQLRHLTKDRKRNVLGRELTIALLLGLFLATPFSLVLYLWKGHLVLTLSIALTIAFAPLWVAFLGYLIPQIFHKLKIDARVAAGPVLLAIADSSVLLIYLLLATGLMLFFR